MAKVDNNWKEISFGEFDNSATEYLSELVHELLLEKGIDTTSYSFGIDVTYLEIENKTHSQQMQDDLEPIGGMSADWTFHTTDDDKEFEDE